MLEPISCLIIGTKMRDNTFTDMFDIESMVKPLPKLCCLTLGIRVLLKCFVQYLAREQAEAAAAAKKAEEDKAKLMEAIAASGKSVDEIIELLKQ